MDDLSRHPDDATLFDLFDGALDAAREQEVRAHLQRCAACAAFVAAARAGAPETTTAVVAMPEDASERLHLRLRDGWRERTALIGAAEARQDASGAPVPSVPLVGMEEDLVPPRIEPPRAADRRRPWRRRLVPVLAFGVLAALAGTSVWIGDDTARPGASGGSADSAAESTTGATSAPADGDIAAVPDIATDTATAPSAGAPVAATAAGGDDNAASGAADVAVTIPPTAPEPSDGRAVELADGEARVGEIVPPPAGIEQFGDGTICIVTFDQVTIELPDGRIPQQVRQGPFGMFLVCG